MGFLFILVCLIFSQSLRVLVSPLSRPHGFLFCSCLCEPIFMVSRRVIGKDDVKNQLQ